jgi:hypothetical protein
MASIPARLAGFCSGASELAARIAAITSSSTRTDAVKRAPPCTTR